MIVPLVLAPFVTGAKDNVNVSLAAIRAQARNLARRFMDTPGCLDTPLPLRGPSPPLRFGMTVRGAPKANSTSPATHTQSNANPESVSKEPTGVTPANCNAPADVTFLARYFRAPTQWRNQTAIPNAIISAITAEL